MKDRHKCPLYLVDHKVFDIARLSLPRSVIVDQAGAVYVADSGNQGMQNNHFYRIIYLIYKLQLNFFFVFY
jgi:hypothetical protein